MSSIIQPAAFEGLAGDEEEAWICPLFLPPEHLPACAGVSPHQESCPHAFSGCPQPYVSIPSSKDPTLS